MDEEEAFEAWWAEYAKDEDGWYQYGDIEVNKSIAKSAWMAGVCWIWELFPTWH